ncbi:TPA: hypothetical protein ONC18_004163 [Enterobacter kobei]|nr:hypothetical protein [Enterobacter asburiae]HCR1911405.1 hypothetical protein [Enterobacter kobei]
MRELLDSEVCTVTGAATVADVNNFALGVFSHIGSAILGGVMAGTVGGIIGYKHGGDSTGVWGLSLIGQLVGAVGGAVIGGTGGVIAGSLVPLSYAFPLAQQAVKTIISGGIE